MIRMLESRQYNPFTNSTGTSYYDDLMDDGPLNGKSNYSTADYYKFEKAVEGHIEYMTAKEYMNICASKVFTGDPYRAVNPNIVAKYADEMKDGTKFPLPYLNLRKDYEGQEGRHRMLAAAEAFGEDTEFPVLVVTDPHPTEDEMWEYARKKYPKNPQWVYDMISYNFK